jgi:hypothetical protein
VDICLQGLLWFFKDREWGFAVSEEAQPGLRLHTHTKPSVGLKGTVVGDDSRCQTGEPMYKRRGPHFSTMRATIIVPNSEYAYWDNSSLLSLNGSMRGFLFRTELGCFQHRMDAATVISSYNGLYLVLVNLKCCY